MVAWFAPARRLVCRSSRQKRNLARRGISVEKSRPGTLLMDKPAHPIGDTGREPGLKIEKLPTMNTALESGGRETPPPHPGAVGATRGG